jgi:hypothetical protein
MARRKTSKAYLSIQRLAKNQTFTNFSDAQQITVGFLGVLFPLSGVEEPLPLAPLRAGTFALTKEKITTLAKHDTY